MVLRCFASALLALLLVGGLFVVVQLRAGPPDTVKVSQDLVFGGDLLAYEVCLAYEVWDGVPHVVFRWPDGSVVRFDHLRKDWISIEWPPLPAWQLSGDWATLRPFGNAASVGVVLHRPTELFGEVNAASITTLEIEYEGRWHAFPVHRPAFLVRLEGFDGIPVAYRWLDANGVLVWSEGRRPPLRQ